MYVKSLHEKFHHPLHTHRDELTYITINVIFKQGDIHKKVEDIQAKPVRGG